MHLNKLILSLIFIITLNINYADTIPSSILNSERIQMKFGSYGLDILYSDHDTRVSYLYSFDSSNHKKKIYQTFAIVKFLESKIDQETQKRIDNGASIGATLKENGWSISKINLDIARINSDEYPLFKTPESSESLHSLAAHFYKLKIKKEDKFFDYAEILEIHNPGYLNYNELIKIFPVTNRDESHKRLKSILEGVFTERIVLFLVKESNKQ
tara:strand:+ start:11944 stop:12582 length:639 start_codon:yes stop_codon:yes gene_type:complete